MTLFIVHTFTADFGGYIHRFHVKSLVEWNLMLIFAAENTCNMANNDIISRIKDVAAVSIPAGGKAILYGSRARGDAKENSDWDLLILLNKDKLVQDDYDKVSYPFVLLGCDLGTEINPIMYTQKEWEAYNITPFYENVQRDGINII